MALRPHKAMQISGYAGGRQGRPNHLSISHRKVVFSFDFYAGPKASFSLVLMSSCFSIGRNSIFLLTTFLIMDV
jgi:hypothetical protein